jgi:hypothetical protein
LKSGAANFCCLFFTFKTYLEPIFRSNWLNLVLQNRKDLMKRFSLLLLLVLAQSKAIMAQNAKQMHHFSHSVSVESALHTVGMYWEPLYDPAIATSPTATSANSTYERLFGKLELPTVGYQLRYDFNASKSKLPLSVMSGCTVGFNVQSPSYGRFSDLNFHVPLSLMFAFTRSREWKVGLGFTLSKFAREPLQLCGTGDISFTVEDKYLPLRTQLLPHAVVAKEGLGERNRGSILLRLGMLPYLRQYNKYATYALPVRPIDHNTLSASLWANTKSLSITYLYKLQ